CTRVSYGATLFW
nr:immunoglobulin heavy chain junction region [Macaca mulatta]MOY22075.1 immunoglobulin heavy chain junction region [Macaca mulatta]MOY22172.1 immunoglobulin heavy chain junction region [Macaca mulatta]MOY23079.1 immunoglobulin heavy chain junction region [Macaca mulatta]MOY23173.1 immunoglobulin heavy chain junction region [Macaca mulatta]